VKEGVVLAEETKVADIVFRNNSFMIFSSKGETEAIVAAGAFGKRSNLDVKWKRHFTQIKPNKLNHYLAVKYHIKAEFPDDLIALHNFDNGYCGISKVEDGKCCLCYLTKGENIKRSNNNIRQMEESIIMKNPFLKRIFSESEFLYQFPLTISRISFNKKTQVENHVLMIGDSAGLITPLCGNGMSMALHASKLAFEEINQFMQKKTSRFELELQYMQQWEKYFGSRLQTGRLIQGFFGSETLSNFLISSIKPFPKFITYLIRQTHGQPF
jgi:flavin-dependent dehydrogenase